MNVYSSLGVRRVVNAHGNLTPLGGSLMNPEVMAAMAEAAQCFVHIPDLLEKAGRRIADLVAVEATFVTSGASAGLAIATAACIAGRNPARILRLPDTAGMRNEVVVHKCQRTAWDQAVRLAGATLVEVGLSTSTELWELEEAIGERTAAILYVMQHNPERSLPLDDVVAVAKARDVPVIVDAAAELPPVCNLRAFTALGADLAVFSGGKMIRGPQSSGLIVGRRDLIESCAANASPNFGIGRPMKVGKEEIVGLVKAVELFVASDFQAERRRWERQVSYLASELGDVRGWRCRRVCPGEDDVLPKEVPRLHVRSDAGRGAVAPAEARRRLFDGEPSVAVGLWGDELVVNPIVLADGEEAIVARRLAEVLPD